MLLGAGIHTKVQVCLLIELVRAVFHACSIFGIAIVVIRANKNTAMRDRISECEGIFGAFIEAFSGEVISV